MHNALNSIPSKTHNNMFMERSEVFNNLAKYSGFILFFYIIIFIHYINLGSGVAEAVVLISLTGTNIFVILRLNKENSYDC